ncbi:MAG: hypothetical protein ABFD89_23450 [Bryobacteraceae bacterium]
MKQPETKGNLVQVSFRVEEHLKRDFDIKIVQAGDSATRLLRDFVMDYCGRTAEDRASIRGERRSKKNIEAHEMLDEILGHGNPEADWITGNLISFVKAIRGGADEELLMQPRAVNEKRPRGK